MAVVVRCPGCRGASQVGPEAIGLLVVCPRCSDPFLAVEDAPPVAPPAGSPPKAAGRGEPPRPPTPSRERPVEPTVRARRRGWAEPVAPPADYASHSPRRPRPGTVGAAPADPHDHPVVHAAGLPVSVLIGLALLPFAIPLLWLVGPLALGQQPALSLAAPSALALSASVLCLAVVYTVDWSAATRVKGVLMLVGLAYFTGLSLFFLKKEMVDRAKETFGPGLTWQDFTPPDRAYRVKMPGRPKPVPEQPLPGWKLTCHQTAQKGFAGGVVFVVGTGPDKVGNPGDPEEETRWLDGVKRALGDATGGGTVANWQEVKRLHPGWEGEIHLPDGNTVRLVRVHRVGGKIYYLSAEGPDLAPGDDLPQQFFDSFLATPPKP